jgi:hypothetical protein
LLDDSKIVDVQQKTRQQQKQKAEFDQWVCFWDERNNCFFGTVLTIPVPEI